MDGSDVVTLRKAMLEICGHEFSNLELMRIAVTHPSAAETRTNSYERLEFIGDSVLGLVVSEMLYRMYSDNSEGDLTKKRMAMVCGSRVVEVARTLGLGGILRMSKGEMSCGGQNNDSNLENALEALIGALYIDGGLEVARNFVVKHWQRAAESMISVPLTDYKSALQEWSQSKALPVPEYKVVSKIGSEHEPIFTVEVSISSSIIEKVVGSGKNKKLAEQAAAKLMLEKITS
ncbi:MAG: ribonuclease III [Aaplasma endosymbiont of Hyalomma asiaticum]